MDPVTVIYPDLRSAHTGITITTPMLALLTDTTGLNTLWAASSSARDPGITGTTVEVTTVAATTAVGTTETATTDTVSTAGTEIGIVGVIGTVGVTGTVGAASEAAIGETTDSEAMVDSTAVAVSMVEAADSMAAVADSTVEVVTAEVTGTTNQRRG